MCVQQKKTIHDEKRMHHRNDAFFVKTPAEMEAYFKHIPEALENAAKLGDAVQRRVQAGRDLPAQVPGARRDDRGVVPGRDRRRTGLKQRIEEAHRRGDKIDGDAYAARLALELGVIQKMDFAGYFLIVWDFIRYAKEHGIPVGPGRGSGAGSLVAYSMRITDIDPIANKLLFERFLNPERVSMPDFDIDFCMNRRDEVIELRHRQVRQGQRRPDRDHAPDQGALGRARRRRARWACRSPRPTRSRSSCPSRSRARARPSPRRSRRSRGSRRSTTRTRPTATLLDHAKELEGLNRHAGKHAAGVVIGDRPLWEYVPCFRPAGDEGGIVTQYDKDMVEKAGLVKFDFLGLKTLTVIQNCLDHVNRERAARGEARARSLRHPARRRRGLQDDLAGRRHRRVPAGVVGLPRAAEEAAPRLLRGHRRRRRALPSRAARGRHGRRLHRAQARAQAGRVRPPDAGADPEGHLRRHRLPGAGHADLVGAGRLQPGQGGPAPPRDGEEEGRGHGQGEGRLPRRRQGRRGSTPRSPSASST